MQEMGIIESNDKIANCAEEFFSHFLQESLIIEKHAAVGTRAFCNAKQFSIIVSLTINNYWGLSFFYMFQGTIFWFLMNKKYVLIFFSGGPPTRFCFEQQRGIFPMKVVRGSHKHFGVPCRFWDKLMFRCDSIVAFYRSLHSSFLICTNSPGDIYLGPSMMILVIWKDGMQFVTSLNQESVASFYSWWQDWSF